MISTKFGDKERLDVGFTTDGDGKDAEVGANALMLPATGNWPRAKGSPRVGRKENCWFWIEIGDCSSLPLLLA